PLNLGFDGLEALALLVGEAALTGEACQKLALPFGQQVPEGLTPHHRPLVTGADVERLRALPPRIGGAGEGACRGRCRREPAPDQARQIKIAFLEDATDRV